MNVKDYLGEQGVPFEVLEHRPTYDASRLAQAVHVSGYEVAKTVLLRADGDYAHVVAVLPATHRVDLGKVSKALGGSRVELATEAELAKHCPDCEIGALPPFGWKYGMETLVDESLTADEHIVFESNFHCEAIRMTYEDFHRLAQPLVVAFARPYRQRP